MSFEMFAGDTMRLNFAITNTSTGFPLDLTGATVIWQMSRYRNPKFSSTPLLTKDEDTGLEVVDSFNGMILVRLSPEDTEEFSGEFYHELQVTDADGDVSTAFTGTFTIKKNLIRPPAA